MSLKGILLFFYHLYLLQLGSILLESDGKTKWTRKQRKSKTKNICKINFILKKIRNNCRLHKFKTSQWLKEEVSNGKVKRYVYTQCAHIEIFYIIYICNDIDKRNFKICIYSFILLTNTKFVTYIVHPCIIIHYIRNF